MSQLCFWQVTAALILWIQKSNSNSPESKSLYDQYYWQANDERSRDEYNLKDQDYYWQENILKYRPDGGTGKFNVFYVFDIEDGTITRNTIKNHKRNRKTFTSSKIVNKEEYMDISKPADDHLKPVFDSRELLYLIGKDRDGNNKNAYDNHIREFLRNIDENEQKTVKKLWDKLTYDASVIMILRRSTIRKGKKTENTTKKNPSKKVGKKAAVVTLKELESRKEEQLHHHRLEIIKDFLSQSSLSTKYVWAEISRIQRTKIVKDELRRMVKILEKPKFSKVKQAVIKCYEDFKSKMPRDATPWFIANKFNNFVVNIVKDNQNDGVGYK